MNKRQRRELRKLSDNVQRVAPQPADDHIHFPTFVEGTPRDYEWRPSSAELFEAARQPSPFAVAVEELATESQPVS